MLSCITCLSLRSIVGAERVQITRPRVGIVVGLIALSLGMASSSFLVHLDGGSLSDSPGSRGYRDGERTERVWGIGNPCETFEELTSAQLQNVW
jgi:hypothetical protein